VKQGYTDVLSSAQPGSSGGRFGVQGGSQNSQASRTLDAVSKKGNFTDQNMNAVMTKLGPDADKTSVIVQTPGGKRKVNLAVAMDKYRDQLATGQAVFSSDSPEDIAGQNITAAGGYLDMSRKSGAQSETADPSGGKLGVAATATDLNPKLQSPDTSGSAGQITLSPQAAQFFQLNMNNDPNSTGTPGSPSGATSPLARGLSTLPSS
jgi:hypothetical protein